MSAQRYKIESVRNPFGGRGYLGMVTGEHFDGTPLTLYSMDDDGNMVEYATAGEARFAMQNTLYALMSFRFAPGSSVTNEAIHKKIKENWQAMDEAKKRIEDGELPDVE